MKIIRHAMMDLTDIIGYIYPDAKETNNFHKKWKHSQTRKEFFFKKKSKYELISTILVPSLYNSKITKMCGSSWIAELAHRFAVSVWWQGPK